MKIALLEDDKIIAEQIADYFKTNNHSVICFGDGESFLYAEEIISTDIFLLDINTPKLSGLEVLKEVKRFNFTQPIIFITAMSDISYIKEAFGGGASDYIKKPFLFEELELRIHRLLHNSNRTIYFNGFEFNFSNMKLFFGPNEIELSDLEKKLIYTLARNIGNFISSQMLIDYVWDDGAICENTLRTKIKRLREKLGKDIIKNSRNMGYKIEK